MKYLIILTAFLLSCSSSNIGNQNESEWLIPIGEVFDGGPGKDGIPSVDDPQFNTVLQSDIQDNNLVVGIVIDGVAKAYPHNILDWHEIVNDNIGNSNFALTYCPLTGTAIGWKGEVDGQKTTFGVSGKLFNSNLIPYDRTTDSNWTQIGLDCVNGESIGEKVTTIPVIETSWATWKKAYPMSQIMNTNTGFSRNYSNYPYGDYRTNHDNLIFPVSNLDETLPAKERVLAIIDGNTSKVYSIKLFGEGRIIEDKIDGEMVVIIGSEKDNFIVAFKKDELSNLTFVKDQLPVIAEDQDGNQIRIDGTTTGSNSIENLESLNSFMSYFFALGSFYELDIYE